MRGSKLIKETVGQSGIGRRMQYSKYMVVPEKYLRSEECIRLNAPVLSFTVAAPHSYHLMQQVPADIQHLRAKKRPVINVLRQISLNIKVSCRFHVNKLVPSTPCKPVVVSNLLDTRGKIKRKQNVCGSHL